MIMFGIVNVNLSNSILLFLFLLHIAAALFTIIGK